MYQVFFLLYNKKKTDRIEKEYSKLVLVFVFLRKQAVSKWIECKSKKCFLKNTIIIKSASVRGSYKEGRDVFLADSWRRIKARIELGRSFHQQGTFNLKVCESDFLITQ